MTQTTIHKPTGEFREPALSFEERMERRRQEESAKPAIEASTASNQTGPLRWRTTSERPVTGAVTNVLFRTTSGGKIFVLSGLIYEDGVPAIFNIATNNFLEYSWKTLDGWIPWSDLPK